MRTASPYETKAFASHFAQSATAPPGRAAAMTVASVGASPVTNGVSGTRAVATLPQRIASQIPGLIVCTSFIVSSSS